MNWLSAVDLAAAVQDPAVAADFSNDTWWISLIKAVIILVLLLLQVLFAIWFERKVVAVMQIRVGPNVHGPKGLLQSLADAMKLMLKEELDVSKADRVTYLLAPMISVFAALMVYAVIPFGPEVSIFGVVTPLQLTDFSVAGLYVLAVAAMGVYGIVLGGWSSGSTYPLLGGVRSTAQIISYELGMGLALVTVFMMSGSMSTSMIVESQTTVWWALPLLPAFIIYIISMTGEVNRLPFDLPEAEGELVGGYMTEYSSMKFAWFFLAEYINMLNVSAVAATLFLGGWRAPFGLSYINDGMFNEGWWPVLWFLGKVWFFMFLFVWIRGTLLRFRYDQFMNLGWKILIPASLVWVVIVGTVQAVRRFTGLDLTTFIYIAAAIVAVAIVVLYFLPDKNAGKPQYLGGVGRAPEIPEGEFDAFAGGFPVPPLPGQQLPPSPRKARATASVSAQAAQLTDGTKEQEDDE